MGGLCTHLDHLISVRGQMGCGTPVKEGSKPYSGLMIIIFITLNSSYSGIDCDAIDIILGCLGCVIVGVDRIIVVWSLGKFSELYFMGYADGMMKGWPRSVIALHLRVQYCHIHVVKRLASSVLFFFPQGAGDKCG